MGIVFCSLLPSVCLLFAHENFKKKIIKQKFDMLMHFNYFFCLSVWLFVCWYMLLSFYECESTIASVLGLFASEFDGCGLICIFFCCRLLFFVFFSFSYD